MTIDTSKTYTATHDDRAEPSTSRSTPRPPPTRSTTSCSWPTRATTTAWSSTGSSRVHRPDRGPDAAPAVGPATIADELPAKSASARAQYPLGSVAMANTGQPNTNGSQFFIVSGPQGESLPHTYSLFGQVTRG